MASPRPEYALCMECFEFRDAEDFGKVITLRTAGLITIHRKEDVSEEGKPEEIAWVRNVKPVDRRSPVNFGHGRCSKCKQPEMPSTESSVDNEG